VQAIKYNVHHSGMRTLLHRLLPAPAINLLRRARAHQLVAKISEERALSRVPRVRCDVVNACSTLNLDEIFASHDLSLWKLVAGRVEAGGLTHNMGGVNPGDRRAICALVAHLRPTKVLEVGTHIGSSTLVLAATLAGTGARITTVDVLNVNDPQTRPWERYGARQSPADLVRDEAPVSFVTGSSLAFLSGTSDQYDLIFLDGDHTAATVYRELPLALSRLAPGGVILMHDYFPGGRRLWRDGELILGPYLAVKRLIDDGAPIQDVPLGELPWPTKLGGNMTSLAAILATSPR
jgi:predicted O-methyltransferase YrrM